MPQSRTKTYVADRCEPLVQAVGAGKVDLHALTHNGYPGTPLPAAQLPGVLSVGFWDAKGRQDWGLAQHCNEGIEITYLETGTLAFTVSGTTAKLNPGSLTITRPWQPHALGNPQVGPGRLHWLILDVGIRKPHQRWQWPKWLLLTTEDLKHLTELLSHNETPVWPVDSRTASYFISIAELIQNPDKTARVSSLAVLINGLILSIYKMLIGRNIPLNPELTTSQRSAQLFLESVKGNQALLIQNWTAAAMAEQCGLGVTHFTKLCKQITNMTPLEYMNYHRIEIAARLLSKNPNQSITEIGLQTGFNTSQYFATVFNRYKKCSPKQYRQR
jgi:AraC family L-rhamnose operon regulatory protein RhaS